MRRSTVSRSSSTPADSRVDAARCSQDHLFVYLHLPKTGGNTVRVVLSCVFGDAAWRDLHLPSRVDPDAFASRAAAEEAAVEAAAADPRVGGIAIDSGFGIHCYTRRQVRYLASVREPHSRLVSYWNFAFRTRNDKPRWAVYEQYGLDVRAIVESQVDPGLENDQVRALSGAGAEALGEEHLQMAITNIRSGIEYVFRTEHLDTELPGYLRQVWHPHWEVPRVNVGGRTEPVHLSAKAMGYLLDRNRLDIALYDWFDREGAALFAGRELEVTQTRPHPSLTPARVAD